MKSRLITLAALCATIVGAAATSAKAAESYVPDEVLVGYQSTQTPAPAADAERRMGIHALAAQAPVAQERLLKLPRGRTVGQAIRELRRQPGVAYAVPNFIAHAEGKGVIPNDPGRSHVKSGWERMQWNFVGPASVNAPEAWANLKADHRPGGRGVVVAVLDTGVAYRTWHQFRRSPDFNHTRFVHPYDFIAHNRFPLDRESHGTFVAGTVAESTNNGIGLTGLAYGAELMPVRVLDAQGTGDAATISRGIRYAASHGARVINMSLEFTPDVTAADIPDVLSAIRFALHRGVVVVAASGNESSKQVAYPARAPSVISVGATTRDRCLADYSNYGPALDLVAPGGGDDAYVVGDHNCHPSRSLPPVYQMTFFDSAKPASFGFPGGTYGTSMSSPHVAATAALVIAARVLGAHPTPDQMRAHLEKTAQPLGSAPRPNRPYGWGLLDAAAATRS